MVRFEVEPDHGIGMTFAEAVTEAAGVYTVEAAHDGAGGYSCSATDFTDDDFVAFRIVIDTYNQLFATDNTRHVVVAGNRFLIGDATEDPTAQPKAPQV